MKKGCLVLIMYCILSIISFSKIQNYRGLSFDDDIFGRTFHCKGIGNLYIGIAMLSVGKNYSEEINNPEKQRILFKETNGLLGAIDENIRVTKGWRKSSNALNNVNLYYKQNCRKVQRGEIESYSNSYLIDALIEDFYSYLENYVY